MSKVRILQQGCDPSAADDTSLPYTTYLVEYLQDGMTKFDIVLANKKVDVFDYYWDLYRNDFVTFNQTNGRINPKLWNDPSKPKGKKK